MESYPAPSMRIQRSDTIWLTVTAILTILLWQTPQGRYLLYPFTILGTWFHEMGHGLMAMLLGAEFRSLEIFSNGSGIATHTGKVAFGRFGQALVAAAGPMGPPIAGAMLLRVSRYGDVAKLVLTLFGLGLIISVVIWVKTVVGVVVISLLGVVILIIGLQKASGLQRAALQFLGVQACISTFRDFNYLFTAGGSISGQQFASDTSVIANHLFLPHWAWGLLLTLFSLTILFKSLKASTR